jgi:hypothetical protein
LKRPVRQCTAWAPNWTANVRQHFRGICKAAGIAEGWAPRKLRHSFVSRFGLGRAGGGDRAAGRSLKFEDDPGHLPELRPVLVKGAEVMDQIFG